MYPHVNIPGSTVFPAQDNERNENQDAVVPYKSSYQRQYLHGNDEPQKNALVLVYLSGMHE